MKIGYNILRGYVVGILLMGISATQSPAQSSTTHDGADNYRTRLIPYPTAELAAKHGLAKQRYMQPLTEWDSTADGALRSEFTYPFSWLERQVFARVESVGQPYELYINGKRAGGSTNGFVATEFNITKLSQEDKNSVELRLLSSDIVAEIECFDKPAQPHYIYHIATARARARYSMASNTRFRGCG